MYLDNLDNVLVEYNGRKKEATKAGDEMRENTGEEVAITLTLNSMRKMIPHSSRLRHIQSTCRNSTINRDEEKRFYNKSILFYSELV